MHELGLGSIVTGIGFALAKFIAFASDCYENDPLINPSVLPDGIQVVGWDAWNDCYIHATVRRAYADTIEPLLGKRSTIQDRHSLAAIDTMDKLKNLRYRIPVVKAAWGEIAAMLQLIAKKIVR